MTIKQRTESWMNNEILPGKTNTDLGKQTQVMMKSKCEGLENLIQRQIRKAKLKYFQNQIVDKNMMQRKYGQF